MSTGSMWGKFHRMLELYLHPLPPPGPLTIVVQWLEQDIPETTTDMDAELIRAHAAAVVDVWPDLPPPPDASTARTTGRVGGVSSSTHVLGVGRTRGAGNVGSPEASAGGG